MPRMALKSVIEPVGTGTRSDVPSSLPFIDSQHEGRGPGRAGARRHDVDGRGAGPAEVLVRAVDEHAGRRCRRGSVVIRPCSTPNASSRTLTIGTKQFVVQLALDTTLCTLGSKSVWLTPITNVPSAPSDGAETTTSGAPASRWAAALSREVKSPVDSTTRSTPSSRPRQLGGVAHLQHLQLVVADLDPRVRRLDGLREGAEQRVVLEEVGHRLERAEVVDGDEVDVGAALGARRGRGCGRCGRSR